VSLHAGWAELNDALKELRLRWEDTRAGWKDAAAADFEEHHWNPLVAQVDATLRAMDRLSPILIRAQRECSAGRESS
jgi:hypothetical protein